MKKNIIYIAVSMIAAAFLLGSCGKSNSEEDASAHREYLAVGLSNSSHKWSIIDKEGNVVVETEYPTTGASISNVFDDVYWVRSNGRCQLFSVNQPNQPLLDEEHAHAADFIYCGYTFVATRKQPIRIINTKGETVATLPESIRECHSFGKDGYALVKDESRNFGVVDTSGKMTIEPSYSKLAPLGDGIFLAELHQFLDAQGNVLGEIDPQKYAVTNLGMEKGKMIVRNADSRQCCVINQRGEELFALPMAADASPYRGGYAAFRDASGLWGVLDDDGNVAVQPQYPMLFNVGGGDFIAMANCGFCVINAKGETVVGFNYEKFDVEKLGENFVMGKSYKYMIVNRQGEELATFKKIGQIDSPVAYYQR